MGVVDGDEREQESAAGISVSMLRNMNIETV